MTAMRPQPRPGVLDIEPYVPGKSSAPGVAKVFKLSSNETPLGPSPRAIAAYQGLGRSSRGLSGRLRQATCAKPSAAPSGSIPTASSAARAPTICCIFLARAYLADGDEAIHTTHGFLIYPIATLGTGAKPVVAPEKNYTADVDAILAAVTKKTKIVFLANPNNPTGTVSVVRRGQAAASRPAAATCCSCSTPPMPNMSAATITKPASSSSPPSENVVMCRTFSKIHGLAALRLGWMFGPAA